jgi:hypothetical protein
MAGLKSCLIVFEGKSTNYYLNFAIHLSMFLVNSGFAYVTKVAKSVINIYYFGGVNN